MNKVQKTVVMGTISIAIAMALLSSTAISNVYAPSSRRGLYVQAGDNVVFTGQGTHNADGTYTYVVAAQGKTGEPYNVKLDCKILTADDAASNYTMDCHCQQ